MKKIKNKQLLIFTLCILFVNSCSHHLPINNLTNVKLNIVSKVNSIQYATLDAENLNSALWIEKYEIIYSPEIIVININYTLDNSGYSGPLHLEFIMNEKVKMVKIGDNIIWKKS